MGTKSILFFADRLPPLIGGMEVHAQYFIKHFSKHLLFPLLGIISKTSTGADVLITKKNKIIINIENLQQIFTPDIIFFNSGKWIEKLRVLRKLFPHATFVYRTGGNEILKAPLVNQDISDHKIRQAYWVSTLNQTIGIIITNSHFTETRLREIGITCPFALCIGGVNISALKRNTVTQPHKHPRIFCAARFVPYKNHHLLLSLIHQLVIRGNDINLRLAGDGPLLSDIKSLVKEYKLESIVQFLGPINNKKSCEEISNADIYMQLSTDNLTKVPGGEYIHSEGMGRSILEAISAGTFVIAGRCGALPEIVTKNRGILINVNNVNLPQITDVVESLLKKLPIKLPFTDQYSWKNLFLHYEKLMLKKVM